jgi:hypothetical protein
LTTFLGACANPSEPEPSAGISPAVHDGSLRVATLDYQMGDLSDPAVLAKYENSDVLITLCENFWGNEEKAGRLDLVRAVNPDIKILGYFRSKVVRTEWRDITSANDSYRRELYDAAKPYWTYTTTGDTLMDWKNAVVYDYTQPAVRREMIAIFKKYQDTSGNRFDGIFWDYFAPRLYIAPNVTNLEGEPDMDGDGVAHWDDADELASFLAGQDAWVAEMQEAMGAGFIQIANGPRATRDSVFAGKLDGIFYELFPNVSFNGGARFAEALSPDRYNNLFTARDWPRKSNGGPWLILSHSQRVGGYRTVDGTWEEAVPEDFNRVMALLTGATSIHFAPGLRFQAGLPRVALSLGRPLGGVTVDGHSYTREFENGRVEMEMGSGEYPAPFSYRIEQNHEVVEMVAVAP